MRKCFVIVFFILNTLSTFAQEKFVVYFDFGQDILSRSEEDRVDSWINNNRNLSVIGLSGFCDSVDTKQYNLALASRRIKSVTEILNRSKIKISKSVVLKSIGENFTLSQISSENRKVEIYYEILDQKSEVKTEAEVKSSEVKDHIALEKQFTKARKGDIIKIENINFHLDSEEVVTESQPLLFELYEVLKNNPGLKIEIHGHICCNPDTNDTQLSFRRAKFIFTFLRNQGIELNRLGFKGFGSSRPIYKIPEQSLKEERANRRVEILITENKKP